MSEAKFSNVSRKAARETVRIVGLHDQIPEKSVTAYFNGFMMGAQFGKQWAESQRAVEEL